MSEKILIPTETIELPSQGKIYGINHPLAAGTVELKYMTAREEDILTNINLLKQGLAVERMMESLIKSPIKYDDLLIGDRNALIIAARILGYGSQYSFEYVEEGRDGEDSIKETVTVDLQSLKNKLVDYTLYNNKNEFTYELPHSKNTITFKLLTEGDEKTINKELKALKKAGIPAGEITTRLKTQILSINGDYEPKVVRDFVDNYLIAKDSNPLRAYMASITPDIDMKISFTLSNGKEVEENLPLTAEFFFPGG